MNFRPYSRFGCTHGVVMKSQMHKLNDRTDGLEPTVFRELPS